MGISLSTARILAPASYVVNFLVQMYGMNSKPNMLDIHNLRFAGFSPFAYAIPLFFTGQQVIQLWWLYRLCLAKDAYVSDQERAAMVKYAPVYALGNSCIAAWLPLWNSDKLDRSFIFVAINSISQLLYVWLGLPERTSATNLTHWNAKTFAGIGLLDFIHNLSSAYYPGVPPSTVIKLATPIISGLLMSSTDWILSSCVAYDLAALALGQTLGAGDNGRGADAGWGGLLGLYAAGAGLMSAFKYSQGGAGVRL